MHEAVSPDAEVPENYAESVTLEPGTLEEGWTLLSPLILRVEREDDGWFVVSDDIFDLYGDAATLRAAVRQYISSLIDHYEFSMREAESNLLALPVREKLRQYVQSVAH